jgi:hypothetical protein
MVHDTLRSHKSYCQNFALSPFNIQNTVQIKYAEMSEVMALYKSRVCTRNTSGTLKFHDVRAKVSLNSANRYKCNYERLAWKLNWYLRRNVQIRNFENSKCIKNIHKSLLFFCMLLHT